MFPPRIDEWNSLWYNYCIDYTQNSCFGQVFLFSGYKMGKNRFLCAVLTVILLLSAAVPVASGSEDTANSAVLNGGSTLEGQCPLLGSGTIVENAAAAILYELNSDTLMYAANADAQYSPSSLVKIMTALVALENGSLSDEIIVKEDVIAAIPSSAASVDLVAGEVVTLEQMLYCMLVGSANDAAAVIADHVGGGQDHFVAMMNQKAGELGCTGTVYMNAHGLHNDAQLTTARDTVRILREALRNEKFYEIFCGHTYYMDATNKSDERTVYTSNYLMNTSIIQIYYDERVVGCRTGITYTGQRNIASLAEKDGMSLISVVLGSENEMSEDGRSTKTYGGYVETTTLLDAGFEGYHFAQIFFDGQVIRQMKVENGENDVFLGCKKGASVVLPASSTMETVTVQYVDLPQVLRAPIAEGQQIARIQVWDGGTCYADVDLYTLNTVEAVDPVVQDDGNTESGEEAAVSPLKVIGIIVLAILALVLVLRALPLIRKRMARRRGRKYRKYRGRSR